MTVQKPVKLVLNLRFHSAMDSILEPVPVLEPPEPVRRTGFAIPGKISLPIYQANENPWSWGKQLSSSKLINDFRSSSSLILHCLLQVTRRTRRCCGSRGSASSRRGRWRCARTADSPWRRPHRSRYQGSEWRTRVSKITNIHMTTLSNLTDKFYSKPWLWFNLWLPYSMQNGYVQLPRNIPSLSIIKVLTPLILDSWSPFKCKPTYPQPTMQNKDHIFSQLAWWKRPNQFNLLIWNI